MLILILLLTINQYDSLIDFGIEFTIYICPGYDIKLFQMVQIQSWNFGECGVPLH